MVFIFRMNLLYCLSVVVLLCGFSSCYEYNPYERPWYERTDSNDQPNDETTDDLSEAFNCTRGQICEIAVSSIKNASILPFTVPIRIVTLSGHLELNLSTDQTLLTGLPMRTGLSKGMITYAMNGQKANIFFMVFVSRSSLHNHRFEITLKQPDRGGSKDFEGVDFLKTLANALDGLYTSLTMERFLNQHEILVIYNNSLSSTECQGDDILNMKGKMLSSNGNIKEEFARRLGSKYQIKTIQMETYDSCLLFFHNYTTSHRILKNTIYVCIIIVVIIIIFAIFCGTAIFYIRMPRNYNF
uniref:Peptidase S72 domain-containing protein n=2 Tax=Caenorhabditis tropicalis TaxID=1561998 RepID=A0A1I7TL47_9PELO